MAFKKWNIGNPNKAEAKEIASQTNVDPFTALIARSRNITDATELEFMFSDELILGDTYELIDIGNAAEHIRNAINENKKIAVFGDYDCDGVVATAIMYKSLKKLGADVISYIPDRIDEGYGMHKASIDALKKKGVEFIITVDNGISAIEEIDYALSLGIKTVVTDHHLPKETLPNALAVVDPHRADCPSAFKEICGAQVAFKVVCAVEDKEPEEIFHRYADILTVAIIADVMPLINENRSMVKHGLQYINHYPSIGIQALSSVAGLERGNIRPTNVSFGIVPRINAAGRMSDANDALELLLCDDMMKAISIANNLYDLNASRQETEREIIAEAIKKIERYGYQHNRVIVVADKKWHLGTIGIVAAKICDRYGKPTIVINSDGEIAHGSGRSIKGFNMHDAVTAVSDLLEGFGGHELAAGISLKTENISKFRKKINAYAINQPYAAPSINIDFKINPAALSSDMLDAIGVLAPFGTGNPIPTFGIMGVKLQKIMPVSEGKHLRLMFYKDNHSFQAMLYGVSPETFQYRIDDVVDLAVHLHFNKFEDAYPLTVVIRAMRVNGIDQDILFDDINELDSFFSGYKYLPEKLLPSREQIGAVYRYIAKFSPARPMLVTAFLKKIGIAKISIALIILEELALISVEKTRIITLNASKNDLINSDTYKKLSSEV